MKSKKIIFACIAIFFCVLQGQAQAVEKLLMINVYENFRENENSRIIVTENDKVLEQVTLPGFTGKNFETTQLEVSKILLKYKNAGYILKEVLRGSNIIWGGSTVMVSTFLFEK